MIRRREVLQAAAGFLLLGGSGPWPRPSRAGPAPTEPFSYARLKGRARGLAASEYQPPERALPDALVALDYDRYQAIRFCRERALWAAEGLPFRVEFFHRGFRIKNKVRIHEVVDGVAREIAYDPRMFDLHKSGVAAESLPADLGFAGLRIRSQRNGFEEIASFLDASYFRAVGRSLQYGLSARGLAVDTGLDTGEEFPVFTEFWLVRPGKDAERLTLYALLDSTSITGAFRFDIAPREPLVIDVDAALYPRRAIRRLGIAPLTSMYLEGENDRRAAFDWRPEIHDSDGLSLWTGNGEWIWRPLANPADIRFSSFVDENPRGFGLLQRDRAFDHYEDDGAWYDRRPSVWAEPRGHWGHGTVELMEMPAPDETIDNVVAFWSPEQPVHAGQEQLFSYRLHWGEKAPFASPLGRVVATRTGIGGIVGQKHEYFSWRFVVDFAGGSFARLDRKAEVVPVITASRGAVELASARPLEALRGYRAMFDLRPAGGGREPVDLRLFLKWKHRSLTETWIYQWTPPSSVEREALLRKLGGG